MHEFGVSPSVRWANRVIKQYLRAFDHKRPFTWGKFLNWAEWSYNTSKHSGSDLSPYELTFGKKPFTISQYDAGTSNEEVVDDFLSSREAVFAELRKKPLEAQENMKRYVDSNRRDVDSDKEDWVKVQLRHHRQSTVSGHHLAYSKLAKSYYGPYWEFTFTLFSTTRYLNHFITLLLRLALYYLYLPR